MKNKKQQRDALFNSVLESIEKNEFRWDKFFHNFYRSYGQPQFFLFKRNLSVTNTQFAELFSLISSNAEFSYSRKDKPNLLFHTTSHIKFTFTETINSLLETYKDGDHDLIAKFCERYLDIFSSTVAVDMFYGSCSIFLPPGIKIDLAEVVNSSGYIHSAGIPLFIRNIIKSRKPDFTESIINHLEKHKRNYRVPVVAYCHEDFSPDDNDSKELLERGIEHTKLYVEKMSMGRHRLTTVLEDLARLPELKDKIQLAPAGSFKENQKFKTETTIWLITDRAISSNSIRNRGQARYYVCYEQLLLSENPLFIFDENKPAWKSHTTLPHSLTSALLNISNLKQGQSACDPFGGTGTTWFEVKRRKQKVDFISSDLSPITELLHRDNLEFFTLSEDKLNSIVSNFKTANYKKLFESSKIGQPRLELDASTHPLEEAMKLFLLLKKSQPHEEHEYEFSKSFVKQLEGINFETRLYFYLLLKAELRNKGEIKRERLNISKAFQKELGKFLNQVNLFSRKFRTEMETVTISDNYRTVLDNYSKAVIPNFVYESNIKLETWIGTSVKSSFDATKLEESTLDLIICDPPYGFNTIEEDSGLAHLYHKFITNSLKALKPNGQLIICLPAESFTGRDLPYCTNRNIVSRQILTIAHQLNRDVFIPAKSLPHEELFAPYYWEADKVLSRSILHFYIR